MFSRIIALKSFTTISKNIFGTPYFAKISYSFASLDAQRYLHVKSYDKDAGLEAKRAANKFADMDEGGEDQNISSKTRGQEYIEVGEKINKFQSLLEIKEDFKPYKLNDDTEIFGNASKEPMQEDEGDLREEEYISRPTRHSKKLTTKEYAMMIKDHLNNHRLKEAIEVLDKRMLKEDRVKPENYIYNLLISGCAEAGYTRMAFHLFTKMRQRGLKVKESTYTSLFNACANAPSRQDGLTKAIRLRDSLLEAGYEFNVKNYNAMIKTFGHWGDVKTAYILADEMRDKNLQMTAETFNFLLQACASDEKNGFRHCLLTWHKMLEKKLQPDYYSFNAVLRCVRDCGFGELNEMENVLQQILSKNPSNIMIKEISNSSSECITETANDKERNLESISKKASASDNSLVITNEATSLELPNLLLPKPHLGSMVSLSEVRKPHERFLLLGGLSGFLELMKIRNITPDIQTFTTMLEVIPPTKIAEKQLLKYIVKIGLKADIDFFNILIKKRAMRFDYDGGKEVLSMIRTAGLHPDIVTYGVLALGCTTIESSRELLEEMRHKGFRMNVQILGAMLRQGCAQKNFAYICEIMQISLDENIKPNEIFLRHLHQFYQHCARAIDSRHPTTKTKSFKKGHKGFCNKYRMYQEEHAIEGLKLEDAIKKIKERPYRQYVEDEVVGMEPLKNEKLSRKQKLRKYIKKIKIQNLDDEESAETDTKLLHLYNIKSGNESVSLQKFNKELEPRHLKNLNLNNPFRVA